MNNKCGDTIRTVTVFLLVCSMPGFLKAEEALPGAQAALRAGEYSKSRVLFESALKADPQDSRAQAGLLEVMRLTGSYGEGLRLANDFIAKPGVSPALLLETAQLEALQGDYKQAEKLLRACADRQNPGRPATRIAALRHLADLLEATGRRSEAASLWEELLQQYRSGRVGGRPALGNVAVAAWRLGYAQDAKDLFLDATDEKTGGEVLLEALSDFGYLFLEKYNESDALGVFRDCLKINKHYPPALLGVALAKKYESSIEADTYARTALETNPHLTTALDLLAELRLQEENYSEAWTQIQKALSVNPNDLETLSLEAAYQLSRGDKSNFDQVEHKVLSINPAYGAFYHALAENLVMRRKYREAIDQERRALALDPRLWSAHAGLGMNLMRIGDLAGGREELKRAFEGDPFHIWAYNTLDLLDQMDKFAHASSPHFVILMSREDEPALSLQVQDLAEEAYNNLTGRYRFNPKRPLQIELFPDHAGFAVRTLGLPGLGALGVCFGQVIALDSPRARESGSFNWGSTLWHEFAHIITLQMTNHNIPRWYSEGISVYEERRARPGWGDRLNTAFIRAYKEGKLVKASDLNAGIMRPKYPEQTALSYYEASLVCELIEERFGFEKLRTSLLLLGENKSIEEAFRDALGWDLRQLDTEFSRFLDSRVRVTADHLVFKGSAPHGKISSQAPREKQALIAALAAKPDDFFANLQMGTLLRSEKDDKEAEPYLIKAERLFPEYAEPGNSYEVLGAMYQEQKREQDALQQYLAWSRQEDSSVQPLLRAADIYRDRKQWDDAAHMLELSLYIEPYQEKVYTKLGETAIAAGEWRRAIKAYSTLLGLQPVDPGEAHYNLARAFFGAGDSIRAKREVLRALEIAPAYVKAQELLLKLAGGNP